MSRRAVNDDSPLAAGSDAGPIEEPFRGDLFERRSLAARLTKLVKRLPDGGAFAVQAAWGDGKSWFGRHWHADLVKCGVRSIFIDAFESDYVEDPFLLLASEFKTLAEKDSARPGKSFSEKAVAVGRVLIPALAKGAFGAASRFATGTNLLDSVEQGLSAGIDELGDQIGTALSEHLVAVQKRRETVTAFRKLLAELAQSGDGPIVVFVDELDRCSPTFAIRLIERAKHFFEVPGVVFVLLINRDQLEASVRGVYGSEIDAGLYLHKFLLFSLTLPKLINLDWSSDNFALRHTRAVGARLGLANWQSFDDYARTLSAMSQRLSMSFRDIERACTYLALFGEDSHASPLVAYLSALRVSRPELFRGLQARSNSAHQEALEMVKAWRRIGSELWLLPILEAVHAVAREPQLPKSDVQVQKALNGLEKELHLGQVGDTAELISRFCAKLDISVS